MKKKKAREIHNKKPANPILAKIEEMYGENYGNRTNKELAEHLRKIGYPALVELARLEE